MSESNGAPVTACGDCLGADILAYCVSGLAELLDISHLETEMWEAYDRFQYSKQVDAERKMLGIPESAPPDVVAQMDQSRATISDTLPEQLAALQWFGLEIAEGWKTAQETVCSDTGRQCSKYIVLKSVVQQSMSELSRHFTGSLPDKD